MIKKTLATISMAVFFAVRIFAANTDITTDTTITSDPNLQDNTITVKDGATYTVDSTVISLKRNSGITIEAGSTLEFKGSNSQLKTLDGLNTIDIYGTMLATNNAGFYPGDNANAKTTFTLYDGARMTAAPGQGYTFEIRRGVSVFNFNKGSVADSINLLKVGDRGDAGFDATFNIEGSVTVNNETALGSAVGFTPAGAGKGAINVFNGGSMTTRTLKAGTIQNFAASISLKDAGSIFRVTGQADLGAANSVAGSGVKVDIASGSQFFVGGALNYNETANMVLNVTSPTQGSSQALLKVNGALTLSGDSSISIDVDSTLASSGAAAGETITIVLFDLGSTISVGGEVKTMGDLAAMTRAELTDFLGTFLEFDFLGNENWKAANLNDIIVSGSHLELILESTGIPEPSTYAAIFGALALAFAAYRRHR